MLPLGQIPSNGSIGNAIGIYSTNVTNIWQQITQTEYSLKYLMQFIISTIFIIDVTVNFINNIIYM